MRFHAPGFQMTSSGAIAAGLSQRHDDSTVKLPEARQIMTILGIFSHLVHNSEAAGQALLAAGKLSNGLINVFDAFLPASLPETSAEQMNSYTFTLRVEASPDMQT